MVQERAEGPKDPTALYLSLRPVTVGSGRVEPYMRKLSSFTGNILIGSYLTDNTLIECSLTESSLSKQKQKNGKRKSRSDGEDNQAILPPADEWCDGAVDARQGGAV